MQQHINSVKNPLRLFISQQQVNLVHSLQKKTKQQKFSRQIHLYDQRINKKIRKD